MTYVNMFLALLFWHALADYPLQGDFLAKAKNKLASIPGVPWWQAMSAHSLIHAGGVAYITGSIWLGAAEFVSHFMIDHAKCTGRFGFSPEADFNIDQAMHIWCNVLWVSVAYSYGLTP